MERTASEERPMWLVQHTANNSHVRHKTSSVINWSQVTTITMLLLKMYTKHISWKYRRHGCLVYRTYPPKSAVTIVQQSDSRELQLFTHERLIMSHEVFTYIKQYEITEIHTTYYKISVMPQQLHFHFLARLQKISLVKSVIRNYCTQGWFTLFP